MFVLFGWPFFLVVAAAAAVVVDVVVVFFPVVNFNYSPVELS